MRNSIHELSVKQWLGVIFLAGLPIVNIFYLYKILFSDEEKPHYRYVRATATVMYTMFGLVVLPAVFFLVMIMLSC